MTRRHRVVFTDAALDDLRAIVDYVVDRDSLAAGRLLETRLRRTVRGLASLPTRCRVVPELRDVGVEGYREAITSPFRIVFRVDTREVVVVAVLDGRRDLEELLLQRAIEKG